MAHVRQQGSSGVTLLGRMNPMETTMQNLIRQTPRQAGIAREFVGATEAGFGGDDFGGQWALPGLQRVFQEQAGGGMSPAEAEAARARIRTGFGAATRGLAGSTFNPGEIAQAGEGALPGLGGALTQFEADRAGARRESLAGAAQTAGTVLPFAAEERSGRRAAFGEALGLIRAGEQPFFAQNTARRRSPATGAGRGYWWGAT